MKPAKRRMVVAELRGMVEGTERSVMRALDRAGANAREVALDTSTSFYKLSALVT